MFGTQVLSVYITFFLMFGTQVLSVYIMLFLMVCTQVMFFLLAGHPMNWTFFVYAIYSQEIQDDAQIV